jgi:hypothetical protein
MMRTRTGILTVQAAAALVAAFALGPTTWATPAAPAIQASLVYAVQGGRVHTAAGAPIDAGTVVIRDGVITEVGAGVAVPADAVVIDAAGLNVYPGLIDMGNDAPIDTGQDEAPAGGGRGGGRGGGGGGQQFDTREDAERAKRENVLRPDFMAARNLRTTSDEQVALASAGVTTVLAAPASGIFKGQSALVNVLVAPDDPQISAIADYRKGLAVVKSPVASHINMAGRGGGQGYPQSLLGTIAFTRQELLNAEWQRDARAHYEQNGGRGPRPVVEPPLDALAPVLAGELPAAFDAGEPREIDRALAMAAEFDLRPIIVGASGAAERTEELRAANASVIFSLNLGGGGGRGGGRGGRGGGGQQSLRAMQAQQNAPKVPAALAAAGVPFAFSSGGQDAADFVRGAGRVVTDGGLDADAALRALTIDAARLAGADDRIGSLEQGKIANLVVTDGDLLDGGTVRHVFIDGRPIDVEEPAAPAGGRGGRGGGRH